MIRIVRRVLVLALMISAFSMYATSSIAGEMDKLTGKKFAQLANGGVLYDNWIEEVGVKIDKTHPAYPAKGKKKGASTWRCKECHGWDYKGKSGAYSSGSHYTGIVGIRAYANQSPAEIVKIIKNDTHAFGNMMPDDAVESLALFVAYGQVDTDRYVDRNFSNQLIHTVRGVGYILKEDS